MPSALRSCFICFSGFFAGGSDSPTTRRLRRYRVEKDGSSCMASTADAGAMAPFSKQCMKNGTFSSAYLPSDRKTSAEERHAGAGRVDVTQWEPRAEEKELIRRTWSDDFDFLYELGSKIYTYIFENNPQTKTLFPNIHRHGAAWKHSKEFRGQALNFVQTISYAVKNVYHMQDNLVPHLRKIGQRHVKFAERGFKPEYWDIFQDAIETSLEAHIASLEDFLPEQRSEAIRIWRQLAVYITTHMKYGYFEYLTFPINGK
ncbi:CRE-GLB-18 protein [Aphelenchoides avenae]|nr:CRE-GLB-18 protein [Aphelenchus avenae]